MMTSTDDGDTRSSCMACGLSGPSGDTVGAGCWCLQGPRGRRPLGPRRSTAEKPHSSNKPSAPAMKCPGPRCEWVVGAHPVLLHTGGRLGLTRGGLARPCDCITGARRGRRACSGPAEAMAAAASRVRGLLRRGLLGRHARRRDSMPASLILVSYLSISTICTARANPAPGLAWPAYTRSRNASPRAAARASRSDAVFSLSSSDFACRARDLRPLIAHGLREVRCRFAPLFGREAPGRCPSRRRSNSRLRHVRHVLVYDRSGAPCWICCMTAAARPASAPWRAGPPSIVPPPVVADRAALSLRCAIGSFAPPWSSPRLRSLASLWPRPPAAMRVCSLRRPTCRPCPLRLACPYCAFACPMCLTLHM